MADTINPKTELTKDGKVLSKHELAELKKSNPSKEELDKLGVRITQENDTHIQMQLGNETIVNASFDREHKGENMTKLKQKGPQTTANSLQTDEVLIPPGRLPEIPLADYMRGRSHMSSRARARRGTDCHLLLLRNPRKACRCISDL